MDTITSKFFIKDRNTGDLIPVTKKQFTHAFRRAEDLRSKRKK